MAMDSLDILKTITRRGVRTSEFWAAAIGAGAIAIVPDEAAMPIAVVVAAYVVARAFVKAVTGKALLTDVEPPVRITERHDVRELR